MEKPRLIYPIIVEGKYDKIKIDSLFSATVVPLGGFGVFNSKEKQALVRKISERGVILLVDSDGGGVQIRSYLNSILPKDKIFNLYIPRIDGKEKRKTHASRSGKLGVEGMPPEILYKILLPFTENSDKAEGSQGLVTSASNTEKATKMITKVDFFKDGLSGGANSSAYRDRLAAEFDLPPGMSANALLAALNLISSYDDYRAALIAIGAREE